MILLKIIQRITVPLSEDTVDIQSVKENEINKPNNRTKGLLLIFLTLKVMIGMNRK